MLPSMMVVRVVQMPASRNVSRAIGRSNPAEDQASARISHRVRFLPVSVNRACFLNRPGSFFCRGGANAQGESFAGAANRNGERARRATLARRAERETQVDAPALQAMRAERG